MITIQFFQSLIVIGSCCYQARRIDGRPSYADILRTCLQMSWRIQTLWNGGRCVVRLDVLSIIVSNGLQDNRHHYPTLRCIAIDFLTCLALSVPCERLFSGSGKIATKCCAQLGAVHFKELQVMKFAWRNNISNLTAWNSSQVEEIDDEFGEYRDLLVADGEQARWDA